ncbi:MAG: hypothetical protein LDL33_15000 [Desulfomonile sp.]|nr:hypothetical protein [Desulfomonile sp.]
MDHPNGTNHGCKPVAPTFVRKDERGLFVEIVNEGPWETIIHGSMAKNAEMGNHYHRECRAYFYLISGRARIAVRHLIDNSMDEVELVAGQGVYLLPFETHVIQYLEDSDFILMKSYRYRNDNPDIYPCKVEP